MVSTEPPLWLKLLLYALVLLLLPILLLTIGLSLLLRPFRKPVDIPAGEVARVLREFRDGTDGDGDIDDFMDWKLADPALESIRQRFLKLDDPTDPAALTALLAEAEALAARDEAGGAGLDSVIDRA